MINPSLIYDTSESQNKSLISAVRRQQSNGKNPARRSSSIEAHWSNETVEKLEQILVDHRNQIETNPESDDDQHRVLIFRLIDLVRRSSTTNQRKSENLDKLFEDIIEIRRRNRFRMESTKQKPVEQQQIQDLLDDTNRLQLLIERQQEKILELTSLLNIRTEQPPSTMRHPIKEPRIIRNENREVAHNLIQQSPKLLICPMCQSVFSSRKMTLEQMNVHIDEHIVHMQNLQFS